MTIYTGYPGQSSTFVPSFEAGGKLQVEFSRNPKSFAINKYIKFVPVKRSIGFYLFISPENAARLVTNNDRVWHDGQEAPTGDDNQMSHMFRKYSTIRYTDPFMLGNKAVDQADWDIIASYSRMSAQQSMTGRTRAVIAKMKTDLTVTTTATLCAGGKFDVGTSTLPYIRIGFNNVAEAILKNTYSAVKRGDIIAVMNPHTATSIARSPEMIDFLKQSPFAKDLIRGDVDDVGSAANWNLPTMFQGFKIVIEETTYNATRPTAGQSLPAPGLSGISGTTTNGAGTYVMDDGDIFFISRPEGLVGSEGVPSFATVQIFSYEDMTVETKNDPDNRRRSGRVVDDFDTQVVAPASGVYLTACTG